MSSSSAHSRRALMGITAALAAAPSTAAKKKKGKNRKKQPPAPLAFAVVLVTQLQLTAEQQLALDCNGAVEHPSSATKTTFADTVTVPIVTAHEDLITQMQLRASQALLGQGNVTVAPDRIAVTLL